MDDRLKPFAESIGEMCNEWANLEGWVTRLFLAVGGWDYRLPNAVLMISCIDVKDRILATKIGAINRCPAGVFLEKICACLDYIDNDLRSARNRFVHDIWAPAEDGRGAMKIDPTPRHGKAPGSGEREVRPYENRYVAIDELREVTADIIDEREFLGRLVECFQNPQDWNMPTRLAEPPRRLRRRRQPEKPHRADNAAPGRKPPRGS